MKPLSLLATLLAAQGVVAGKRASLAGVTEGQILDVLKTNENLLPLNGRIMLAERAKGVKTKRQISPMVAILGSLAGALNSWNLPRPNAKVPEVQTTTSEWPGAKKVKIRYGPYRIPPTGEDNLESKMLNQKGLTNTLAFNAGKPCTGNCVVFAIQPGLEYADGSVADTENGAWLHHAVLINAGQDVQDYTCTEGLQSYMEHLFESGNERTVIPYSILNSTVKSGYHVRGSDTFIINTELMNMDNTEKWAWLTLTFDFVEDHPKDYMEGKVIWMSVGPDRCGGSDHNPFGPTNLTETQQPTETKFAEFSIPWLSKNKGFILGTNGHMHEGGTAIRVFQNDKEICSSVPQYGSGMGGMSMGRRRLRHRRGSSSSSSTTTTTTDKRQLTMDPATLLQLGSALLDSSSSSLSQAVKKKPQRPQKASPQSLLRPLIAPNNYTNADIEHIVSQSECTFAAGLPINPGDRMYIASDYDFAVRQGMKNQKGEVDEVMGIAGTLMAFPYMGL